ncbi:hypothetical protein Tco_0817995 [Tanacetum coccineum]
MNSVETTPVESDEHFETNHDEKSKLSETREEGQGLHTAEEMTSAGFGIYWAESARQISDKGDLSGYRRGISFEGDFLGAVPSYTLIRDPLLRLCHRRYAPRRKRRAMISGEQFVAHLFEHFGLLTELGDTWAWVASGLERQSDAAAGSPKDVEDAHAEVEGDQAVLAPVQAPQPPPTTAQTRTMP